MRFEISFENCRKVNCEIQNDDYEQQRRPDTLMEQQNRKLEDAKRTGFATLEIASSTNTELNRQTEVLLRNQDRVRE